MADEFEFSERLPFGLSELPTEPLGPEVYSFSPEQLAAFRIRGGARKRDAVDRLDNPPPTFPTPLAAAAMQMAPGGGVTDALGLLPDLERGGFHPGVVSNLWNGRFGDAGWQLLGALGDGMYLAGPAGPILGVTAGTALKGKRFSDLLKRTARTDLFDLENLQPRQAVHQSPLPRELPPGGIPSRMFDLINNGDVAEKLKDQIRAGLGAGKNWYNTEPLRQAFVKELGPAEGEAAYNKFLNYVAASSPLSGVGVSIRNASYYYGRVMRGEGLPHIGEANPPGYGHFARTLHQRLLRQLEEHGFDPDLQAKVTSFAENLRGNYLPVTVDMHAFRLPAMLTGDIRFLKAQHRRFIDSIKDPNEKKLAAEKLLQDALEKPAMWDRVRSNEYAAMEQLYQNIARELGVSPAQAQAAAWLAGAQKTGLKSADFDSFMKFFDNRIARTALEKGISPEEVLREFIRGRMNLVLLEDPSNSIA